MLIAAAALAAALVILLFGGLTLPLDYLDGRLETLASRLLQRPVTVYGPVRLKPSLTPALELGGVEIGNPPGWPAGQGHLLAVERGLAEIRLVELLRGRVRITDLEFSGVDLTLTTRADGTSNYIFPGLHRAQERGTGGSASHEFSGLDRLSLADVRLRYVDEASGNDFRFVIDEAHGQGGPGEDLAFSLRGELFDRPCTLEVAGGTLGNLIRGTGNWPVDGRLAVGEATLQVDGSFNWSRPDRAGYLAVALNGDSLAELGTLGGLALPDVTGYSVAGDIRLLPATVQVTGLEIQAAELSGPLTADLIVSLHGVRPQVAGTVMLEELDLGRLAGRTGTPPVPEATTGADTLEEGGPEPADAPEAAAENGSAEEDGAQESELGEVTALLSSALPWHLLSLIDSDLHLQIDRIEHGALVVGGVKGAVSLVDGALVVPLEARLPGLPVRVQIEIDGGAQTPGVALGLSSPGGDLGPTFTALTAAEGSPGRLGALHLGLEAKGATLMELFTSMAVDLELQDAEFFSNDTRLASFDNLSFAYQLKQLLALTAAGELLGQPLEAHVVISSRPEGERTSLAEIDVGACGSSLQLSVWRPAGQQSGATFTLASEGQGLCGLMAPVERFTGGDAPFAISAAGTLSEDRLEVDITRLALGHLDLDGNLVVTDDGSGTPEIAAALHSGRIDLPALLQARADEGGTPPPEPLEAEGWEQLLSAVQEILAWKMLPLHEYLTANGRLDLTVEELDTGQVSFADLRVSALVENGVLKPSPFQARIGGSLFTGSGAVDTTGEKPVVAVDLATDDFVLAELLGEFGIQQAPEVSIGHVGLDFEFPGTTVEEMLRQADYRVEVRDGRWLIERDEIEDLLLSIERLDYRVRPGTAAVIGVRGDINGLPLSVEMTGDGLFEGQSGVPIVLDLEAGLADTRLTVQGRLQRDENNGYAIELRTGLEGERMNSLDRILGTQLPPFGPYRIGGALVTAETGLGLHDMIVTVGDSSLRGRLDLSEVDRDDVSDTKVLGVRGELSAETIQLDDFGLQGWSPFTGGRDRRVDVEGKAAAAGSEKEPAVEAEETTDAKQGGPDQDLPGLLSPELADMLEGEFSVRVGEVRSGRDLLGGGTLKARVTQGRYLLEDLGLDIPGGAVRIEGDYQPGDDQARASLRMEVSQFDYGIMARRVKPDANLKGEVNVDLDLNAEAAGPRELTRHLNGRLRFGVRPIEFEAGIMDLWAANIIVEALPALLKGEPSVVNCLAGDFTLSDGVMTPELFLLDATKIRVEGGGTVDLKSDKIDFYLRPTPKSAHFFSLATPITVSGSIYKPSISVTPAAVLKTVFRQLTSVVTVPFQWLFSDNLEADGRAACEAAMEWVHLSD